MTLTYTAAFLGGLLSLLAPCGAMLLPAFFTYSFADRARLIQRTGLFFLGLITVLVPLGLAMGTVGAFIQRYRAELAITIGVLVIIAGIVTALQISLPHPRLRRPARVKTMPEGVRAATPAPKQPRDRSSSSAVYLLGISYGFAGVGCSGPILGAILGLSATAASPLTGAATMFSYALGMALPILILALAWQAFDVKRWWRPRPVRFFGRDTTVGSLVSGIIFIALGALLIYSRGTLSFGLLSSGGQIEIESRIMTAFAAIPNYLFGLIVVVLVALLSLYLYSQRRQK